MTRSKMTDYLYHYTTQEGLYGILKTQCLWATHYKFLNDTSELVLHKDDFLKYLDSKNKENKKEIIKEYEIRLNNLIENIFITSFCKPINDQENNGLLSMYRGYGVGGGYTIVLDKLKIEDLIENENQNYIYYDVSKVNLNYMKETEERVKAHFEIIESLLSSIVEYDKNIRPQFYNLNPANKKTELQTKWKQNLENNKELFKKIYELSLNYKHIAFEEESEYRVAVNLDNTLSLYRAAGYSDNEIERERVREFKGLKERKINFREKDNILVPYIELFGDSKSKIALDEIEQKHITLPIKKIIVGPHKDKAQRAASLKTLLRNTNIEVVVSEIPYV